MERDFYLANKQNKKGFAFSTSMYILGKKLLI